MKRPNKIRIGDIFLDKYFGTIRIIMSKKSYWYNYIYYYSEQSKEETIMGCLGMSYSDFRDNAHGVAEYYLGNISDIKPKGKF